MDTLALTALQARVGDDVGCSRWLEVSQDRIDRFADITEDFQWIHTQPERAAKETPFGGSIAHGFLSLSLLSAMAADVLPAIEGSVMGINYGFDKVRFINPVKAGSRVRGHFSLNDALHDVARNRLRLTHAVEVEISNEDRPALVCEWLSMIVLG